MTWMVNLELHMHHELYTNMEFRSIAELSNLETLMIRYGYSTKHGFDDLVMEHLALRAAHEGKLQRLRAVIVQNSEAFSSAVFSFLQKFRCLDSVCVLNTSIKAKDRAAKDFGWKRQKRYSNSFCLARRACSGADQTFTVSIRCFVPLSVLVCLAITRETLSFCSAPV